MKNDYLWEGSGEPDPEVERLERLLSEFRSTRATPDFSEFPLGPQRSTRPPSAPWWTRWFAATGAWRRPAFAFAAVASIALAVIVWTVFQSRSSWEVVRLDGSPVVGGNELRGSGRLRVGQWLETDAASRAKINVGRIGEVEVEPNTRIGLLRARPEEHRLSLERGTMHAFIWAPPRRFFVNTPSAIAVDLGCAYTLNVDDSGAGVLNVTHGWVVFEKDGRESFVPAAATCYTRPGVGPGTPFYGAATPAFKEALARLDFEPLDEAARAATMDTLLAEARRDDGLTLWHLLSRGNDAARARVYDRMAQLIPPPSGVTREGILASDPRMRDLWWRELGLGDTDWWRMWKGPVPGTLGTQQ